MIYPQISYANIKYMHANHATHIKLGTYAIGKQVLRVLLGNHSNFLIRGYPSRLCTNSATLRWKTCTGKRFPPSGPTPDLLYQYLSENTPYVSLSIVQAIQSQQLTASLNNTLTIQCVT